MARYKQPLDTNVLTAAKARLHHIFDLHDTVLVSFSGGKDSLAALHLTWEVAKERGHKQVNAVFYDEELLPDSVIDFIDHYRQLPWVNLRWFCIPLQSTKFILGKATEYVQWDPGRDHIRPMPAHAERLPPGDRRVFTQYTLNPYFCDAYKGKVAIITGIRADESLFRLRASLNKLNDSYINATKTSKGSLCKPLYDWSENDIFRYFYEQGITYCPIYDAQIWNRDSLRVSTPLHAESAKKFNRLRAADPVFYGRLIRLFPEMQVQERYWHELDRKAIKRQYGQSYDGIRAYILEQIPDEAQQAKALGALNRVIVRARKKPDCYPPAYVFTYIHNGAYKRELLPKKV